MDTIISVDAMGGDRGPEAVVEGVSRAAASSPGIHFLIHGDSEVLNECLRRHRRLGDRCTVRHSEAVVSMSERPSQAVRHGKGSSMWAAVDSVKRGDASAVVSCGNTGALMAISLLLLKKAPGIHRPAIACLWPSYNEHGFNILLDVGADIKADEEDLFKYGLLGAAYAKTGLGVAYPRVGLLNVGTESFKGRSEIQAADKLMDQRQFDGEYSYVGFVEGSDIPSNRVDVIVTDGFTGNIVIKSVEGAASLIRAFLKDAFRHTMLSRLGGVFAITSIRRLFKRIDPRRANGGVFLGLNGTVVKSHGSADPIAVEAAIEFAGKLAKSHVTSGVVTELSSKGQRTGTASIEPGANTA
ncbi:MAG: phosphate acyltransferase PlsX [Rhodobacteraceae bacterium]|nr:phosphate acyltransferase PlsX [Paracoccaceae bacterium]